MGLVPFAFTPCIWSTLSTFLPSWTPWLSGPVSPWQVVTLHVPLIPSTVGLLGAAELARMRPGAILLNTCRGAVVDERAVAAALTAGKLGGFGADPRLAIATPMPGTVLGAQKLFTVV
jgi:lactate dehydrogenase-like 2-hydroxyacid dehydrogenase